MPTYSSSDRVRFGRNLRGILNDLKRDEETAARELGIPVETLERYLTGEAAMPYFLIERAASVWPVSRRNFFISEDDTDSGLVLMTAGQSKATSRVLSRGGVAYYEYRDTAMSRGAPFRPEWIRELVEVDDDNPENPNVHWNKGHFMHQATMFIGPVNFYFELNGERHCVPMNTGDSMYITPYTPHTFTRRKDGTEDDAVIIAVTFGGKLYGDGQQELSFLGPELGSRLLLDYSTRATPYASTLKNVLAQKGMPLEVLAEETGFRRELLERMLDGLFIPSEDDLGRVAKALRVPVRELMPITPRGNDVVVVKSAETRRWGNQGYVFFELAPTPNVPYMSQFLVSPRTQRPDMILVPAHQYVYCISDNVTLFTHTTTPRDLSKGDSVYLKPGIPHKFSGNGELYVVRVGGRVSGDAQHEMALLDRRGFDRLCGELTKWYDPKGTT